ncbi:ATP-grasp domain-containing protein [Massilia sp. METH4]|uniref:ATP-grasp domain-containing protein n=1 Tax=Massilia sp. METH4 TaxID=3123041 RepID=UPI0030D5DA62
MLKVFAFDHGGTGRASGARPPAARRQDDALMLRALCADLRLLPGVELLTLDGAVAGETRQPFHIRFGACVHAADAVWPLAPVGGGTLEWLSREVLRHGRILLGSAPDAVQVAASKTKTCAALARAALPTVATFGAGDVLPAGPGAWVVKPDDGAGSHGTRLFQDSAAAQAWAAAQHGSGLVLQPFVAGRVGSLSLLCRDGRARLLACNEQRMAVEDNRFRCLGATVNGLADLAQRLEPLGQAVAAALPGLWGYAAVDFILAAEGPVLLGVHPRLTISYAGLRTSTGVNPAEAVLALLQGALPGAPAPRTPARVDVAAFGPR